jgi:3-oxoacyl-[acyl-carrier protein] reductase
MKKLLYSNIAIVTGASNDRGIGSAICRKLASEGADIFFAYWQANEEWYDHFRNEIQSFGVNCEGLEVDLANRNSHIELLDSVSEKLGTPTILVNDAAHSIDSSFMDLDEKTLDDHYAVNIRATCLLSVEFARRFRASEKISRTYN